MNTRVKKSLAVAGVASSLGLAVVAGTGLASAATSTDGSGNVTDPQSSLVDKLASKFNLNKSDVQAVFDEERKEHQAKHQQRMEERLTQAVTDGKLTEEQKDKIVAKMKEIKAEMDANRDAMQGKTAEERKAHMEAKRAELEQWAKDNNLPTDYFRLSMKLGHGGPGGAGYGR